MAKALVGPTGYGTFGIVWRDFPAMERRGGYSGPYRTQKEAEDGARMWFEQYDVQGQIEQVENVNRIDWNNGCAVVGCKDEGRPQVCPYDGRRHHHGHIHYENDHPAHPEMKFRGGEWRDMCNAHYAQIVAALDQRRVSTAP